MTPIPHWVSASFVAVFVTLFIGTSPAAAPDNWREVRGDALRSSRSDLASERESAFESFRDGQDHVEAAELLVKTIISPNTDLILRRHARDVLATFRADECREMLYRMLRSDPDKSHLLLEAFAGMEDERGPEIGGLAIKKGASMRKGGDPIMAAGIRCLVSSGTLSDGAIDSIIERAGDGHPIAVRKAATDAMLTLRKPKCVDTLVELLDDDALSKRARLLLVRLAGEDAGPGRSDWEAWWKGKNGTVPEGVAGTVEAAEKLIAAATEAAIVAGEMPEEVTFYGVPIEGENIVFVLDASSSMAGYQLERLQSETRRMVEQLPETHKFALVFYPKNECFPAELHVADQETKDRAYKFIDKRVVVRGTPTGDAMEFAFRRFVVGQEVDAIYLLSDGQPSKPIPDVLQMIDDLNIGLYVAINTIYLGEGPKPVVEDPDNPDAEKKEEPVQDPTAPPDAPITTGWEFLKEVARRHGGTFNIIEVNEE